MKSVCLLTRRAGTTHAAFRDYYETRHCKLGMKYYPFAKYLRNHLVASSRPVDFDCISEFYIEDGRLSADPRQGEAATALDIDERHFMNQAMIRPARVEESILWGPARDVAAPGTQRQMLLLDPAPGVDEESFRRAIDEWSQAMVRLPGVQRLSLDRVSGAATGSSFPCCVLLSVWLAHGGEAIEPPPVPRAIVLQVALLADVCETPPEEIAALYDPV